MNKFVKFLLVSGLSASFLVGCSTAKNESTTTENTETTVLKVASHTTPMTDIVEIAAENIAEPYSIELVEVSDNIQYNESVNFDESYANFAQHEPFMEQYNKEKSAHLKAIQPIYNPVVGFYSKNYDKIEDLPEGAEIALASDQTNEARGLAILADHGLIEVDESIAIPELTLDNITANPHNYKFTSVDLLNLNASYQDSIDLVFNYPTYASQIDLITDDALILENPEDYTYAIQVVVKEENVDKEATKALVKAFTSQDVADFLSELEDKGHLVRTFEVSK